MWKSSLKEMFGTATRWEHWLGRLLLCATLFAMLLFCFNVRIGGVFHSAGLTWVLIGLICMLTGLGMELFPPEMVQYQSRPRLASDGNIIGPPGTRTTLGVVFLALGIWVGLN